MYQAPTLEKYGTFRQLTQFSRNKDHIGDDLIPGIGLQCNAKAPPSDPIACLRS